MLQRIIYDQNTRSMNKTIEVEKKKEKLRRF